MIKTLSKIFDFLTGKPVVPSILTSTKQFNDYTIQQQKNHSHSMVAGGFELMSYTTRFTPFTLLMISFETFAKKS